MNPGIERDGCEEGGRLKQAALDTLAECRQGIILQARRALLLRLLAGGTATADDVRAEVDLPAGVDPRVFGEVPRTLARLGIIEAAGFVQSVRPARHASWIRSWRLADRAGAVAWLRAHPVPAAPTMGTQLGLFSESPAAAAPAPWELDDLAAQNKNPS